MKRKVRSDLSYGTLGIGYVNDEMLKYSGKDIEVDAGLVFNGWSWTEDMLDPIETSQINPNMTELKITKEAVLAAAAKCSTAKATLETLFPEVFASSTKRLLPENFIIQSPDGRVVVRNSLYDKLNADHLYLGSSFNFELVQDSANAYLKVTPK